MENKNNRFVFITSGADVFINRPAKEEGHIVKTTALMEELKSRLSDNNSPLVAVIFLLINEYKDTLDFLKKNRGNIFYQFVLFDNENKLNSDRLDVSDVSGYRTGSISAVEFEFIVQKSFSNIDMFYSVLIERDEYRAKLADTKQDQDDLINIGKALSSEKDSDKLLRLILFLGKKITGADAGSIYLVEIDENGNKRLGFKYSHTFSREIPLEEFYVAMNKKSIAGYVAVTGNVLNIPDVNRIPGDAPYSFNSSFDEQNSYITRSMLAVPMVNHVDEIIGVIQLINSKEDLRGKGSGNEAFSIKLETPLDFDKYVTTFNSKYNSLLQAIAGQAAVAIQNNTLIKQIQNQFEEFVKASVNAIESRDPATSGHSFRVADVCKDLALAVNNEKQGNLKDYYFTENMIRELEFAALLHDFGKVYIDLAIFQKAKKLFPEDFENLMMRLDYLYRFIELDYTNRENTILLENGISKSDQLKFNDEKKETLERVKDIKEKLKILNEPTIMDQNPDKILEEMAESIEKINCINIDGLRMNIITDNNRINLSIKRGSLNPAERKEIESHVLHTYNFVSRIPWPPEYKNIPEIALRHHETLDGSGYPYGLQGKGNMLLQSRIMTIADIYDALTASDRPYKKAVPIDRVVKILKEEAETGKLDKDLVDLFINNKLYEKKRD